MDAKQIIGVIGMAVTILIILITFIYYYRRYNKADVVRLFLGMVLTCASVLVLENAYSLFEAEYGKPISVISILILISTFVYALVFDIKKEY